MRASTRRALTDGMAAAWKLSDADRDRLRAMENDDETLAAMYIVRALSDSIFRDGHLDWMTDPRKSLDGKSPLQLILSGKEGVLKAREHVEMLANPGFT